MKKNKKILLAVVALIAVVALALGAWFIFSPKGTAGSKEIAVTVVYSDKTSKDFPIKTSAEFLRGALEEQKLVAGTESEFGLFVLTVDGVTVDDAKQEWWCFTKGGETVMTGVDATPIANGDKFEITLTTGY